MQIIKFASFSIEVRIYIFENCGELPTNTYVSRILKYL